MAPFLTVAGRDVLFAHWPLGPDALRPRVPDPLAVDTFDGSAWVSALAFENTAVAPGSSGVRGVGRAFPQLNVRTYVTAGGDPGVYFLSLDSGGRLPAAVGRRAFGLPFRHAEMRMTRRGDEVTFRSRRRDRGAEPARFGCRYRPAGEPFRADPGTPESFCVERDRYFFPASEDERAGVLRDEPDGGLLAGRVERTPWELRPVDATIRYNSLFEAAGLPTPSADPAVQYSPGFEMGVEPLERLAIRSPTS